MSKIGKKPVSIKNVEVRLRDGALEVKGPKGVLTLDIPPEIEVKIDRKNQQIVVERKGNSKLAKSLHGTIRALINNMVIGVTEGYKKELIYQGVGYKASVQGNELVLDVGFSHEVRYPIPEGINISVNKDRIIVEGIDKQKVGQVAAEIRAVRPPDAYKGHGIRYADEELRLKPGKAAVKGAEGGAGSE